MLNLAFGSGLVLLGVALVIKEAVGGYQCPDRMHIILGTFGWVVTVAGFGMVLAAVTRA